MSIVNAGSPQLYKCEKHGKTTRNIQVSLGVDYLDGYYCLVCYSELIQRTCKKLIPIEPEEEENESGSND